MINFMVDNERNLYDGSPEDTGPRFVVDRRKNSEDEHDLWIGGDRETGLYVLLPRGVMREMATKPVNRVLTQLATLTQGTAISYMQQRHLSYHELALALAQARIKELDNEASSLAGEISKLRMDR